MTEADERLYLEELLLESARWTRDPDEPYCSVELEIRDRLRRLNHVNTVDKNGMAQSVVERGLAKAAARSGQRHGQRHGQLRPGFHRVTVDGKKLTLHESQLEKVPYTQSPTGYRWVVKDVDNGKSES